MRRGYAGRPIRPLFQGRNQGVSREFFRETDVADDVGDPDDQSVGDSILQTASIAQWVSGAVVTAPILRTRRAIAF